MTNHVHLLATSERPGVLATKMQSLGRRYVRYVNATDKPRFSIRRNFKVNKAA